MAIDKTIRTLISRREPIEDIYSYVEQTGKLIPLRKSVSNLTIAGITSMEEFSLNYHIMWSRREEMTSFLDLVHYGRHNDCSDIHLSRELPPVFRKRQTLSE